MNADGIRNIQSKGEITPIMPLSANTKSIANTGNVLFLPTSISTGVMASKEMADVTREEIQARIDASEAKNDTKIVRLEGKLDLVLQAVQSSRHDVLETAKISRQEANDNRRWVVGNIWLLFAAVVAVIAILVTVAPVIFDMGVKWRETITSEINMRLHDNNVPKSSQ
jgi:hypothetical protein